MNMSKNSYAEKEMADKKTYFFSYRQFLGFYDLKIESALSKIHHTK